MSGARKVFFIIFGFSLLIGLIIGLINLVAPGAASVELNGEQVEGMTGLWTSLLASGIPGLIFGLIGAGITSLFTRSKKKRSNSNKW
ncbi:hypothetical protein MNBD_ALPHA12-498 [hydrothermal vent metagenome]|uniref:Uncharacterized protein n=1 Tax=hydrothermal vent metagenome TaxID=652676 RepID=A0A3B0THI0_9ZZZZ